MRALFTVFFLTLIAVKWWMKLYADDRSGVTLWLSVSAALVALLQWVVYYNWHPIGFALHAAR